MAPLPDFLGIGAERAGTSWIYACLQEHPELCMPYKELHYFSRERNWKKDPTWYRNHFSNCSSQQLLGEFSTSYLSCEAAPERIHETIPEARLIVSLRDPIDRAYSSFRNDRASGNLPEDTSFAKAVTEHDRYTTRGRYATQLRRFREYFGPEDLLVLRYESIEGNPRGFLRSIFRFLGVDESFVPSMMNERINASRRVRFQGFDKYLNRVSKWFRGQRWTRPFWWTAKRLGVGRLIRAANTRDEESEGPDPESVEYLRKELVPEVQKLRFMLDWDDVWTDNFPGTTSHA